MGKSEIVLQLAVFGTAAAIIGLLVAKVYPVSNFKNNPLPVLNQARVKNAESGLQTYPPTSIKIASIGLNLPIEAGVTSGNQWTLYDDKVSWLTTSETPGFGNVILYAHNRIGLFGGLKNLKVGDEINVESGGKNFSYKINLKQKVTPDNVNAVLSKNNQLTLYTCDGSFDQKRLIVTAVPNIN